MNEIFDQLTVKIIFCLILFVGILFYKVYNSAYLSNFKEYWKKSYDINHPPILIYSFSRVFGLSIILSGLNFLKNTTVALNIFHFFFWSLLILVLYIASVYIIESIILYNFNTRDELFKKMNLTYSCISMSIGLSTAIVMKKTIMESNHSLILFLILWLASLVLLGCAGRIFEYVSKLKFNKLVIQKNMTIAISYSGYFIGCSEMISTCFSNNSPDVTTFASSTFLKFLLCLIIFPIFMIGIKNIFPLTVPQMGHGSNLDEFLDNNQPPIGYGIYEAVLFISSSLLTSVIVDEVELGIIYPFF